MVYAKQHFVYAYQYPESRNDHSGMGDHTAYAGVRASNGALMIWSVLHG